MGRSASTVVPDAHVNRAFAQRVIGWHHRHGRHDLPWQKADPYAIWVSEIMLQQTQVATVVPYYQRFMAAFPDVRALAAAPLDAVLALWSGLGYYARARSLHAAARVLVERYDARFPRDPDAISALPGIGRSTAAAIAALAFGVPAPILDGNVKRVLCRVFGIEGDPAAAATQRTLWSVAERLMPTREAAAYTQGLMDLGATVCVRRAPRCERCPLRNQCVAAQQGRTDELPQVRTRPARRTRSVAMLMLRHAACILLEKRPACGIWGGLWCMPQASLDEDPRVVCERRFGARAMEIVRLPRLDHDFTHFRLHIHPVRIEVAALAPGVAEPGTLWLPLDEARAAAIPAPVRKLLEAA